MERTNPHPPFDTTDKRGGKKKRRSRPISHRRRRQSARHPSSPLNAISTRPLFFALEIVLLFSQAQTKVRRHLPQEKTLLTLLQIKTLNKRNPKKRTTKNVPDFFFDFFFCDIFLGHPSCVVVPFDRFIFVVFVVT